MIELLLLAITLIALGWYLAGRVDRWARRRAVVDVPNHRSSHDRPTPTGGGLAIVGLCLTGLLVAGTCGLVELNRQWIGYMVAASLIASVSWIDDLRSLSSRLRLAVHVLAASIFLACGPCWECIELPWLGTIQFEYWGVLLSFLWLVGMTNAYNFMDGLDGLAAGQATVAAVAWLLLGGLTGQPAIGLIGLLLLAGSTGFLIHNWPPARMFMGDVGSTFLGFTFAATGIMATQQHPRLATAAVLVVWPFVFDAGTTFLSRLVRRENVFMAHRSHLYQRLAGTGWPAYKILLLYSGLSLAGLLLATRFVFEPVAAGKTIFIVIPTLAAGLWWGVRRREASEAARKTTQLDAIDADGLAQGEPFWVRISAGSSTFEHADAQPTHSDVSHVG